MAADEKKKKNPSGKTSGAHGQDLGKSGGKSGGKTGGKRSGKSSAPVADVPAKSHRFSEQYLPYLWGALTLFLTVSLVLDFLCKADTPQEHWMGFIGFYLCRGLFGILGWAAHLLIPVFLGLTIFWRRYCRQHLAGLQITLSVLFILLVSGFLHVCACSSDASLVPLIRPADLFERGAVWNGGGILGGLLGWVMYRGLKLAGSIVLMIVVLPLIIMFLVGVTPVEVFSRLWGAIKRRSEASKERKAAEKEARAEEEAAIAEERKQAAMAAARAKARAKAQESSASERSEKRTAAPAPAHDDKTTDVDKTYDTEEAYDADDAYAPEETPAKEPTPSRARPMRIRRNAAVVRVDTDTGEVLDEEAAEETPATEESSAAENMPARKSKSEGSRLGDMWRKDRPTVGGTVPEEDEETGEVEENDERVEERAAERTTGRGDSRTIERDAEDESEDEAEEEAYAPAARTSRTPADRRASHMEIDMNDLEIPAQNEIEDIPEGLDEDPDEEGLGEGAAAQAADGEGKPAAPVVPDYVFPPLDLLARGSDHYESDENEIAENTAILRDTLESFRIRIREITCSCGPTVTRYEVKPDVGVRVRSIANLVDDIALSLAKSGVRIEAPIPGKSAVGIEVPNENPSTVYLRNLIESPDFQNHKSRIASCLGAEVSGRTVVFDINKMPHMLVSGTTGSGKSVCINCIILSILYKARPDQVKLILIDPKKVEFSVYRDIPHLYCPIVTDPKKAAGALYSAVAEMERRFELIEEVGVRNLVGYNEATAGDPERPPMAQMVIIIDELADLMMTAPADVEAAICRLAQKARAAGIHLILGTQRPSVDVITGLIKANIPSRIAFTVKSQVDSRTIIDVAGAEKLIGRGDMLYAPVGATKPLRVQGAFVSDGEVESVVNFVKEHNGKPVYDESFTRQMEVEAARCGAGKHKGEEGGGDDFDALGGDGGDGEDSKFWEAVEVAVDANKVSTSLLQRRAGIGYGRAAKIIDRMEEMGFVSPAEGNKPRKLLITPQEFAELKMNGFKR